MTEENVLQSDLLGGPVNDEKDDPFSRRMRTYAGRVRLEDSGSNPVPEGDPCRAAAAGRVFPLALLAPGESATITNTSDVSLAIAGTLTVSGAQPRALPQPDGDSGPQSEPNDTAFAFSGPLWSAAD